MTLYDAKSTTDFYKIIKKAYISSDVITYTINRIKAEDHRTQIVKQILAHKNARLDFSFVKEYFDKCKYQYHIYDHVQQMNYYIFQTHAITRREKAHIFNTITRIAVLKKLYNISKKMNIFIAMNPDKRRLPNDTEIMNTKHINGGFTFVNRNEIFIIRKEDYDKVLIHEFMHHNTRIHFENWQQSNLNRLKKHFNISAECELLPNEAVIEAYACLINTAFYAVETKADFKLLLKRDQEYSLRLAKKIIHYQNGKAWYEMTNAYCYTILKTIIYLYFDKFLKIYQYNNDTQLTDFLIRQSQNMSKKMQQIPSDKSKWLKQTIFDILNEFLKI